MDQVDVVVPRQRALKHVQVREHVRSLIEAQPPVRVELVDAASARLATGDRPTAEQIADAALREARCDLVT